MTNFLKKLINCIKGVTYIEVMVAISIMGLALTYISIDSRYASKAIAELQQKDKMLYAAQDVIEKYKLELSGGTKNIDGFTVDVAVTNDPDVDPNLTSHLTRITTTVHPPADYPDMGNLVIYSYAFTPTTDIPDIPTNLVATASVNGIILNWDAAQLAETYTIWRSETQGGPYSPIQSGVGINTFTDTSADNMVTYYYVVSAHNVYGDSANSTEASTEIIVNTSVIYSDPTYGVYGDTYIRGGTYANNNYGTQTMLYASTGTWSSNTYKSYIRFDLSSIVGNITNANFYFYGYNSSNSNNTNVDISALSDIKNSDGWSETAMTWNTPPPTIASTPLKSLVMNGTHAYTVSDVTSYCQSEMTSSGNKIATFAITTSSSNIIYMDSRHATNKPYLVIKWTQLPPPGQPQNLTAIPGDTKAILTWNTVNGAQTYNVKRGTSSGNYTTTYTGITGTTYTDSNSGSGLTNGTTYYYAVSAVNSNGESANSTEASVVPSKVNTVTYNPNADAYVRSGMYSTINYGSSDTLQVDNAATGSDSRCVSYYKFDLSSLRGQVITAKLRVYGSNTQDAYMADMGCYSVSGDWDERTINYGNAPNPGSQIGDTDVDDVPSYKEIDISSYVKTQMGDNGIVNIATAGIGTSKMLSFNSKEKSQNKPELVIYKTLLAPLAPSTLNAVPDNTSITLNWTPSAEATSYNVKRGTSSGNYTTTYTGITGTSYTNTGLTNGTTYYYVVTAVDAAGESPNSDEDSAVPNTVITNTFTPTADARVESYNPSSNYGTATWASVTNNGSTNKKTYFKFDLSGYTNNTIVQAKLRVYGASSSNSFNVNAYKVSNTNWTEGGITWSNAPTLEDIVGTATMGTTSQYYEIDVTDYVSNQADLSPLVSLGLYTDTVSSYDATINTKEAAANKPQLYVKMVADVPKQPRNFTATGTNRQVNLSWIAAEGATSYTIKRGTSSGNYNTTYTGITGTSYTNTGLSNGSTYYYVVVAVNSYGSSIASDEACARPNSSGTTLTLTPTMDTYVWDGPYAGYNYGNATPINVYNSGGINDGKNRIIYLQFDISSVTSSPSSATLLVTGKDATGKRSSMVINVYKLSNDSWGEYTTSWNSNLGCDALIGPITLSGSSGTKTITVTSYVTAEYSGNKKVSFCIRASTLNHLGSIISQEGANPPLLQITY